MHPEQGLSDWSSEARISQHIVPNSNRTITQYHGREPWRVTFRLWFASMDDLEQLDDMVGDSACLRYAYGFTKRAGGYRENLAGGGVPYLRLDQTWLLSLEDESYELDGSCEATATFARAYVAPAAYEEPVWPDAPLPIPLPPITLFMSMDGSLNYEDGGAGGVGSSLGSISYAAGHVPGMQSVFIDGTGVSVAGPTPEPAAVFLRYSNDGESWDTAYLTDSSYSEFGIRPSYIYYFGGKIWIESFGDVYINNLATFSAEPDSQQESIIRNNIELPGVSWSDFS